MTTRFTALELAVLDALADELRDQLPDLPGQIAEARPGIRRNTGYGFTTEIIVDRNRPSPDSPLTGRLGTIHGDVPGLIEPMAFQIEVGGGRLLALHGMTYDEATDAIDFPSARVSGLFRIDAQGNSVAWTPRILTGESPLQALQNWETPPEVRPRSARSASSAPHAPPTSPALDFIFGKRGEPDKQAAPPADLPADAVLVAAAIGVMALVALISVILFRLPVVGALVFFGYGASIFRRAKAREMLRKLVIAIRAEGRA